MIGEGGGAGRGMLVATNVTLLASGMALGMWGAFLVPARLPGGVEGLAVVIAVVGNLVAGYGGALGTGRSSSAAMPGGGWLVSVLVLGVLPVRPGDVVLPAGVPHDPGVGTVGLLFVLGGAAGTAVAVALAGRRTGAR